MLDIVPKTIFWGASQEDKNLASKALTATKPPTSEWKATVISQDHKAIAVCLSERKQHLLHDFTTTVHFQGILTAQLSWFLLETALTSSKEAQAAQTGSAHLVFTLLLVKKPTNFHTAAASCSFMEMALNCTHLQKPDLQVQGALNKSALPTFFLNFCY